MLFSLSQVLAAKSPKRGGTQTLGLHALMLCGPAMVPGRVLLNQVL